jgi:hypothetical protein
VAVVHHATAAPSRQPRGKHAREVVTVVDLGANARPCRPESPRVVDEPPPQEPVEAVRLALAAAANEPPKSPNSRPWKERPDGDPPPPILLA